MNKCDEIYLKKLFNSIKLRKMTVTTKISTKFLKMNKLTFFYNFLDSNIEYKANQSKFI